MAHIGQSAPQFESFIIQSCTNTGVWMVDEHDRTSDEKIAVYDFVNREYWAPQVTADPIPIDMMGDAEKIEFLALQRNLNKALLDKGK
ncbi:MAG: hypothetical protein JNL76_06630 [Alphaproteobacteria bacterium]|nr:hypothetical protein [Alphaproteobacteria bacterium]